AGRPVVGAVAGGDRDGLADSLGSDPGRAPPRRGAHRHPARQYGGGAVSAARRRAPAAIASRRRRAGFVSANYTGGMGQEAGVTTSELSFRGADGAEIPCYLAEPTGVEHAPGVVIAPEVFGLNDWIRASARRLAEFGFRA